MTLFEPLPQTNKPLVDPLVQAMFPNAGNTVSVSSTSERRIAIPTTNHPSLSCMRNAEYEGAFLQGLSVREPTQHSK